MPRLQVKTYFWHVRYLFSLQREKKNNIPEATFFLFVTLNDEYGLYTISSWLLKEYFTHFSISSTLLVFPWILEENFVFYITLHVI